MINHLVLVDMLKYIIPLSTSAENEYALLFACSELHVCGSIFQFCHQRACPAKPSGEGQLFGHFEITYV